jgi:hypothetical protein
MPEGWHGWHQIQFNEALNSRAKHMVYPLPASVLVSNIINLKRNWTTSISKRILCLASLAEEFALGQERTKVRFRNYWDIVSYLNNRTHIMVKLTKLSFSEAAAKRTPVRVVIAVCELLDGSGGSGT